MEAKKQPRSIMCLESGAIELMQIWMGKYLPSALSAARISELPRLGRHMLWMDVVCHSY